MSKAEQLAEALRTGDRSGIWYAGMDAAEELRRLAAVEQAYEALKASLGEPVAYELFSVKFANGTQLQYEKPERVPAYINFRTLYAIKE